MLVLSRRPNESIMIGDQIEIKVVEVKGEYIKIGINAPKSIPVHRKEIYDAIQRENIEAANTSITDLKDLHKIIKEEKINKKNEEGNKKP